MTPLVLGVLAALAAAMVAATAEFVRWAAQGRSALQAAIVVFLLLMMSAMFVGVLVYFAIGGRTGLVSGLWTASAIMSASVALVFLAFLREVRAAADPSAPRSRSTSRQWVVVSVIGLVLVNEFLMGWSFGRLAGTFPGGLRWAGADLARGFSASVTSPWFVFPMALEMVLTLRWLLRVVPAAMRPFLWIQPAVMVCSPPTFGASAWQVGSAVAASVLMAVTVGWFLAALLREPSLSGPALGYAVALILSFGVMSGGLYLWADVGRPELFAASLLVQMLVFLLPSTQPARFASERTDAPTSGPSSPGSPEPA